MARRVCIIRSSLRSSLVNSMLSATMPVAMYANDAPISHRSFYMYRMAKEDTLQICIFSKTTVYLVTDYSRMLSFCLLAPEVPEQFVSQLNGLFAP